MIELWAMSGRGKAYGFAPGRVLAVTAIAGAVIMGDSMIYAVLPSSVSAFGVSAGLVGVLLSANRFVRLASNPLADRLFRRFGVERPLAFAVVLSIGTTLAYGFGPGFAVLLLARLLWGLCYSILRLGGYVTVLEEGRKQDRARLMGMFSGGQRAGSIVGVLLGGLLFDLTGRTASFSIVAGLGLMAAPLAIGIAKRPVGLHSRQLVTGARPAKAEQERGGWESLSRVAFGASSKEVDGETPRLLALFLNAFIFYFALGGIVVSTLGFFLSEALGEEGVTLGGWMIGTATLNGALLATNWIAALGAPILGHFGDRRGRERIIIISAPFCICMLMLMAFPGSLALTLAWLPIGFIGAAAVGASTDAIAGDLAPRERRSTVMSRYATWQDLGSAFGPLFGYLALGVMSLTWVYAANACLMAVSVMVFAVVFRGRVGGWRGVGRVK